MSNTFLQGAKSFSGGASPSCAFPSYGPGSYIHVSAYGEATTAYKHGKYQTLVYACLLLVQTIRKTSNLAT